MKMPSTTSGELKARPAADPANLLPSDSPLLKLVRATPEEARETVLLNGVSWSGPLAMPAYLRREERLMQTAHSSNGGVTHWILVDSSETAKPRTILAAVETLRKKAIIAYKDGKVEDSVSHGIGGVFCRDEYRGRGYAGRMMKELATVLQDWQQLEGKRSRFNVLYSDIGKKFYAKNGWEPFPSTHVALKPLDEKAGASKFMPVTPIYSQDLEEFCSLDEKLLRQRIKKFGSDGPDARVAIIPDVDILQWHHAREEFLSSELEGKTPVIKGVCAKGPKNNRVWCIWNRNFARDPAESTLQVLRMAAEDDDAIDFEESAANVISGGSSSKYSNGTPNGRLASGNEDPNIWAIASILRAAQLEASKWGMASIEVWNPSPEVLQAAKLADSNAKFVDRESTSITSLLWYGDKNQRVEWACNEKYGWC